MASSATYVSKMNKYCWIYTLQGVSHRLVDDMEMRLNWTGLNSIYLEPGLGPLIKEICPKYWLFENSPNFNIALSKHNDIVGETGVSWSLG